MESSGSCKNCRKITLTVDDDTGNLVCSSCGVVQDFENFQAHIGGVTGPTGTFVRVGTAGSGSLYNYKQTKVYEAQKLIEDLIFKLGLSASRYDEVKAMVERITEGEYGQGRWFPIFVGACAYVVMRKDKKTLPIVEVANVVGCDSNEFGRMVYRVVDFLDMKLPEFDIVGSFERAIRCCPSFSGVEEEIIGRMLKQGVFFVQCSMKWYLTTGRRPMPIVAAVLVFVAELNQIRVKIEEVAKELYVAVRTCKKRYKELLERLVKVAQVLPWGKDVTVKNIIMNAPSVIQYMELKASSMYSKRASFDHVGFDLDDLVAECLNKEIKYGYDTCDVEKDLQYFEVENSPILTIGGANELQISHECLAMVYSKLLGELPLVKPLAGTEELDWRKQKREYGIYTCREWWTGKSEMSKKLLLKQIIEKDIGLNANPPSYDRGKLAYQRRREKINAAKSRIERIIHPSKADLGDRKDLFLAQCVHSGKKRKMQVEIDWEDLIIETLLLHQVREEEIEKGYYNALLDLHVFN
ncbi:hypothetical protein ACH5RR_018124 [Cinchona calisaya]|uniref:BRF2-like C-terminal domain-containing protein n=1 Tax=Cinchona calisaya TaxID=153742 RepID=A0ABD2ZP57_9GENT